MALEEHDVPQLKRIQLVNYLQQKRTKEEPPCLSKGNFAQKCAEISGVPKEDQTYCVGYEIDFDKKTFSVLVSTSRLMSIALRSEAIHADAT